jgi:regulatory protein
MDPNRQECKQSRRPRKPLDSARLEELAMAYVARFATSATKLQRYLQRKLRERGWEDGEAPDLAVLVNRFVERGYVDDEAYARAKAGDLLRRGYGGRRVRQALGQAGIGGEVADSVAPGELTARKAALHLARKRGFGPFAIDPVPPEVREKHIAAMLRAGHKFDHVRSLLDAEDELGEQPRDQEHREVGDAVAEHDGDEPEHGEEDDRVQHRPDRAEERGRVLDLQFLAHQVREDLAIPPQLAQPRPDAKVWGLGGAFDDGRRGDGCVLPRGRSRTADPQVSAATSLATGRAAAWGRAYGDRSKFRCAGATQAPGSNPRNARAYSTPNPSATLSWVLPASTWDLPQIALALGAGSLTSASVSVIADS